MSPTTSSPERDPRKDHKWSPSPRLLPIAQQVFSEASLAGETEVMLRPADNGSLALLVVFTPEGAADDGLWAEQTVTRTEIAAHKEPQKILDDGVWAAAVHVLGLLERRRRRR